MVYCEYVNLIGYITVDYLLIVYGNVVARVIVHVILFLHASARMARHVWTWCNIMKQSFPTRYLIFFFFLCNETTVFILKQLDYSPAFSTSDSQRDAAELTICS